MTARIIELAKEYGRYGYRRITALLQREGWQVNSKRVARIWRQEGLKVPQKQPKRGRLWLNDGSCIRLKPEHKNHVWAYDFVFDRTHDGRVLKLLTLVDEYSRECLAVEVDRKLTVSGQLSEPSIAAPPELQRACARKMTLDHAQPGGSHAHIPSQEAPVSRGVESDHRTARAERFESASVLPEGRHQPLELRSAPSRAA